MRVVPLLIAAALLGGCADTDVDAANRYVAAVNEAQSDFADESDRLRAQLDASAPSAEGLSALSEFAAAVDGLIVRLDDIDPPPEVRPLHGQLVTAMTRFGDGLRRAGHELASDNAGAILDGQQRLAVATARVTRRFNAAIGEINTVLAG